MSEFHDQIARYRAAIEAFLQAQFCQELPQKRLFDAMRYSLLAGGKRIRPVLTLEFCRICGGDWQSAVPFACALEMIHTYSLIHDDLPCMDNDDYRRGRLTNHKVFGEALAVLAGDGLLTAAFETAANAPADPAVIVRVIRILSEQAGELGMVGGQVLDMQAEEQELTEQGMTSSAARPARSFRRPARSASWLRTELRSSLRPRRPTRRTLALRSRSVTICSTFWATRTSLARPRTWTSTKTHSSACTASARARR